MITIRHETPFDVARREALLDAAFGDCRFTKTAERLREARLPAEGLSFVACADARLIGTVRLWNIAAGRGRPALLLGPLAVAPDFRSCGIGGELMQHALDHARRHGHQVVVLVGDAPYYERFGFTAEKTGALSLPGPYARDRLLARELVPAALEGARGLVHATGRRVSGLPRNDTIRAARAA
ncbi:MAG TPA: N-acetyltransferase [Xanthobacteraceae bacterium]|nr:N-acetyltransferase [Xanthobacteraceae bacterium]